MRLRYGPYAGMTTEVLLLRAPDYAAWIMAHRPEGAVAQAFSSLSAAFDVRPLMETCACGANATHALSYRASTDLILVCDVCASPLAPSEVLDEVTTYAAALNHVAQTYPRAIRRQQRKIIRKLGLAKGMPRRVTEPAADDFLLGILTK
jgi:hypothetical protein